MRCPRLGSEVFFTYCLKEGGELPCARIVLCWQQFFPVERYLKMKLTPEQWEKCFNRTPKDKMTSLIELIEEAKKGMEEKG